MSYIDISYLLGVIELDETFTLYAFNWDYYKIPLSKDWNIIAKCSKKKQDL